LFRRWDQPALEKEVREGNFPLIVELDELGISSYATHDLGLGHNLVRSVSLMPTPQVSVRNATVNLLWFTFTDHVSEFM